jgi:hypothetical protein
LTVSQLIEASKATEQFDENAHRAVLDELQRRSPDSFSLDECAAAYRYLQFVVLWKARRDGGFKPVEPDRQLTVDEDRYGEEIGLLHQLSSRFNYSERLGKWLSGRREKLEDQLRQEDFLGRSCEWDEMTLDQRKDFLADLIGKQMDAFSGAGLELKMPEITVKEMPGLAGAFQHEEDRLRLYLTPAILKKPYPGPAIETAFHEGIHCILAQLALAAKEGSIDSEHPLYADATTQLARLNHKVAPRNIHSLYEADAEERLTEQQGDMFRYGFFAPSGHAGDLRHKLDELLITASVAKNRLSDYCRRLFRGEASESARPEVMNALPPPPAHDAQRDESYRPR